MGGRVRIFLVCLWLCATLSACIPVPIPIYSAWRPLATALDSQGRMHVLYYDGTGYRHGIIQDFQISSEVVDSDVECVSGFRGDEVKMAFDVDRAGNPHLACPTSEGLAHIWKEAGSWNGEMVDLFEHNSWMPRSSLAIDATGAVHIGYPVIRETEMEIRYAVRRNGAWTLELADSRDTSDLGGLWWYTRGVPFPITEISLTPDGTPWIASTNGGHPVYYGAAYGCFNRSGVVRVSERTAEGTWNAQEIFYQEERADESWGLNMFDLSVATSHSGERSVGFVVDEYPGGTYGSYWEYCIMQKNGLSWDTGFSDGGFTVYRWDLADFLSQDIDYDDANQLYVFFSRQHLIGDPFYSTYFTWSLAKLTGSGLQEKTVWDPSLWSGEWGEMEPGAFPFLHVGGSSTVKVAYGGGRIWYMSFLPPF